MTRLHRLVLSSLGLTLILQGAPPELEAKPRASAATLERGRYLTHDVAMCIQCHSPRETSGRIRADDVFSGGKIPFERPGWSETWDTSPPDLIALATGDPKRVRAVLTTGKRPDGTSPNPPMPPFRLAAKDADAVIAYLQSLDRR